MPSRINPRELDAMVEKFDAGMSAEAIGRAHWISARSVQRRLAKRGLHYRRHRTAKAQTALEVRRGAIYLFRGQALSVTRMAVQLRLHPRYLRLWMSRHLPELYDQMKAEVRARRAKPSPEAAAQAASAPPPALTRWRRTAIKRDYLGGYSIAAIALRHRQHRSTVWRLLRRQGVTLRPRATRSPMWLRARQSSPLSGDSPRGPG